MLLSTCSSITDHTLYVAMSTIRVPLCEHLLTIAIVLWLYIWCELKEAGCGTGGWEGGFKPGWTFLLLDMGRGPMLAIMNR